MDQHNTENIEVYMPDEEAELCDVCKTPAPLTLYACLYRCDNCIGEYKRAENRKSAISNALSTLLTEKLLEVSDK